MDFAREGGLTPRRQPGTGEREVGNSRGIRKKAEESKPLIKEKHKGKTDGREEGEERERGRGLLRSAPLHQQSAWMEEYEEEAPDQADVSVISLSLPPEERFTHTIPLFSTSSSSPRPDRLARVC